MEAAVDRISALPDALLGEIITLLPTKDGARTQILSPRWRHLWSSAPLNLDHRGIAWCGRKLDLVVSRILSTHPGPGRRFCVSTTTLDAVDGWLRSPALDNIQELELELDDDSRAHPLPLSVFRFSSTLRAAYFGQCRIPDLAVLQELHLPELRQLELRHVTVSECSLHSLIAGCPALESLLISYCIGFRCLRIDSLTLRGFGFHESFLYDPEHRVVQLNEIIIHNAPCLERALLRANSDIRLLVGTAPNLEMLGIANLSFAFPSPVIQCLPSDKMAMVIPAVKILCVEITPLSLDKAIEFITCFPSLEKLYIQGGFGTKPKPINLWRCKHKDLVKCIDLSLKILVLEKDCGFRGAKSEINFLTFFVLNANVLELMTLYVCSDYYNKEFLEEQHWKLQLDKRASRGARLHFTTENCLRYPLNLKHAQDLEIDPFLM